MAFDGIAIACIKYELENKCVGGRVDKLVQPERDEINLVFRCGGENLRLLISASASNPRVHLTTAQKSNPEKAPMFCMLLRKHIGGGKIVGFEQPDFERALHILIESRNELGDRSVKRLIVEIMGRHSNIILMDDGGRVLGSVKHIDFSVSSVRQIIPGMLYEPPPTQGKINPMTVTKTELARLFAAYDGTADQFLLDTFTGIGHLSAREIADTPDFYAAFAEIQNNRFSPVLLYKNESKIWDFSAIAIEQYGDGILVRPRDSLNEAVDAFYRTRDAQERMRQKTADLSKLIDNNVKRCQKKLALQQQKQKDCAGKERDKQYGDLLTANLYRIEDGARAVEVENYYDGMALVTINLKPELSPSGNAQRYYTLYQKAKNAEIMTEKQMRLTETELAYLESVQDSLARAESDKDVEEIREELVRQGYHVRRGKAAKPRKQAISALASYPLSDGFTVRVGKNNTQNDELTLRLSRSNDIWLHTKNIPGSHTVISTNGRAPSDDVIVEAAKLCAYHSKAKDSANVPVDYTAVKNVKKPNGAKPGMVIYENYNTVYVRPEDHRVT